MHRRWIIAGYILVAAVWIAVRVNVFRTPRGSNVHLPPESATGIEAALAREKLRRNRVDVVRKIVTVSVL